VDIQGASIVAVVQKPGENLQLVLRENQRISAQILNINRSEVMLLVQGLHISARLSSPEQAVLLQNQSVAQFIVKGMSPQGLQLQLVQPEANKGTPVTLSAPLELRTLAQSILNNLGIPTDETTLNLSTALLQRGFKITPQVLLELTNVLQKVAPWGQAELQAALALKEQGLPITPGTVALTANGVPELSKTISQFKNVLSDVLATGNLSPKQAEMVSNVLKQLESLFIKWGASPEQIQGNLQTATQVFSQSVERSLAEMVMQGQVKISEPPESLMLSLGLLRGELARLGNTELLKTIDQFTQQMRTMQFQNLPGSQEPAQGQWFRLDLPLQSMANPIDTKSLVQHTRLRVAYRSRGDEWEVDPDYTRLVIEVEVDEEELVNVDLSIANRKVGARVTASNKELCQFAEEEFPGFQTALEKEGFQLLTSSFKVGKDTAITQIDGGISGARQVEDLDLKI
jgi:hypothetical protein